MPLDHYVQRKLQSNFTDQKRALHLWDKRAGQMRYPAFPPNTMSENDYEDPHWAAVCRQIEGSGLPAIEKLASRRWEDVSNDEWSGLILYVLLHLVRSPSSLERRDAK